MRASVVEPRPETDFDLHLVWIEILASDQESDAVAARKIVPDQRARHYHDRERRLGRELGAAVGIDSMRTIAKKLGVEHELLFQRFKQDFVLGEACLFDSIFFFGPDAVWGDSLPPHLDWATQLDATTYTGFDAERFFWSDALTEELARLAKLHVGPEAPSGESESPKDDAGEEPTPGDAGAR